MAVRTRREIRYSVARHHGLLPFEAQPLSRVPPEKCPYFEDLLESRATMLRKARQLGFTQRQFDAQIKELYRVNDWTKKNRKGEVIADPWKMLRNWEDKYRDKNPEYESPWEPRQRNFRGYQTKVERVMAKLASAA